VIVAGEMKQAVKDEDSNFCGERIALGRGLPSRCGNADGKIADDARAHRAGWVGGEGENVRRLVLARKRRFRLRRRASVVSRTVTWPRSLTAAWPG